MVVTIRKRYQAGRFLKPVAAVSSLNPGSSILGFSDLLLGAVTSSISASCTGEVGHEARSGRPNFSGGRVIGGEVDLDAGMDNAWM